MIFPQKVILISNAKFTWKSCFCRSWSIFFFLTFEACEFLGFGGFFCRIEVLVLDLYFDRPAEVSHLFHCSSRSPALLRLMRVWSMMSIVRLCCMMCSTYLGGKQFGNKHSWSQELGSFYQKQTTRSWYQWCQDRGKRRLFNNTVGSFLIGAFFICKFFHLCVFGLHNTDGWFVSKTTHI